MTPLFKKLNYKETYNCLVINGPASFKEEVKAMENGFHIHEHPEEMESIDFALVFVTTLAEIESSFNQIQDKLQNDFVLWFCYPKSTSKKYKCEFNRDNGWEFLGKSGMEPVRQVAIDEDWSALRFRKTEFIKTMKRGFAISEEGKKRISASHILDI